MKQITFEVVWGKLEAKNCLQRQPFTTYFRHALAFMWNSALWEKFNFFFQQFFVNIVKILFNIFLMFLNFLSLKSFRNSWGDSYIPCLLLIITLLFPCGENNIYSSIKMSQNVMNITVAVNDSSMERIKLLCRVNVCS